MNKLNWCSIFAMWL